MARNNGYALIEAMLASIILASGLVSVAGLFSVTVTVNIRNRQLTAASLLVCDKMEQLQSTGSLSGGSLDPANPVPGFMEYIFIANDGTTTIDLIDSQAPYIRLWQVQGLDLKTATIAVFARIGATVPLELVRATGSW